MKLLHVIPALGPSYGGPSAAMHGMAAALVARGAVVEVATTNADGARNLDVPLGTPVLQRGVSYRYFARLGRGEWKFSLGLTRWLAEHVAEFDVVAVHGMFNYVATAACRLAHGAGIPYVLRPLGMLTDWSLSRRAWKKAPYLRLLERTHLGRASAIHVTSPLEESAVRALGFSNVARVPLGVEDPAPTERASASDSKDAGPLRILYLSRLHPGKGLELLLDAIAIADQREPGRFELWIAGDGEASYRASLEAQMRRLGLERCVRLLGRVSADAKREAFARADVFVLPSASENFGIAVAEALAWGVPVVISPEVGLAPEVERAGAGLVVERSAAALSRALLELASKPVVRVRMGGAARALALSRLTWDACARDLLQVYERAAATRAARAERADVQAAVLREVR